MSRLPERDGHIETSTYGRLEFRVVATNLGDVAFVTPPEGRSFAEDDSTNEIVAAMRARGWEQTPNTGPLDPNDECLWFRHPKV